MSKEKPAGSGGFTKILEKTALIELVGGLGPILGILAGLGLFVVAFFAGDFLEGFATAIIGLTLIFLAFGGAS